MVKKINTHREFHEYLPWFFLGRYEELDKVNMYRLYRELYTRQLALFQAEEGGHDSFAGKVLGYLKADPFLTRNEGAAGQVELADEHELFVDTVLVRSINAGEVVGLDAALSEKLGEIDEGEIFDFIDTPLESFNLNVDGEPGARLFVSVDLEAKDEQIINDFKAYLSRYREIYSVPQPDEVRKVRLEQSIKDISDYRVLPYLDIRLWCLVNGMQITDNVLAKVLFPEDERYDGARDNNTVRKTVRKHANIALSSGFLSGLLSEAKRTGSISTSN